MALATRLREAITRAVATALVLLGLGLLSSPANAQSFTFQANNGGLTGSYPSFTISSPNSGGGYQTARYTAVAPTDLVVTFDWSYSTSDFPGYDGGGYTDGAGDHTLASGGNPSGSITFRVSQGETFGWFAYATDSCCGSGFLTVSNATTSDSTSAVQQFIETRQQLLAQSMDVPGLRHRGASGVTIQAGADGTVGALGFAASTASDVRPGSAVDALSRRVNALPSKDGRPAEQPYSFWIDGDLKLHASGTDSGKFATAMVGADALVKNNLLIGFALEGDWMTQTSSTSDISGTGFFAGPYISLGLTDQITVDADVFFGKTWNAITTTLGGSPYTGNFDTSRVRFDASLNGTMTRDLLTVRPELTLFGIAETADGYSVTGPLGTLSQAGFTTYTIETGTGATLEYRLDQGNGVTLTPFVGVKGGLGVATAGDYGFVRGTAGLRISTEQTLAVDLGLESAWNTSGLGSVGATAHIGGAF